MQVREMLEKAELEVQEALEQGQDDDGSQAEKSDQRTGRVFVDIDDEVEQVNGGKSQIVRINDGSEEDDEGEE